VLGSVLGGREELGTAILVVLRQATVPRSIAMSAIV
jgi:hypothetical protein